MFTSSYRPQCEMATMRDWRGLASLVNISSEMAANFRRSSDKTARVLEVWLQDPTVTVGTLLEYLQRLDRYDVHDDILMDLQEYVARGELVVNQPYQMMINNNPLTPIDEEYSIITVDDRHGYEQQYDAFVLYADADKHFVDELEAKLSGTFRLCTKERLLPGHATEYAPVAQLISKRCQYIILVYSPDFFMSPANTFYRDYAQAVSIESKQHSFQRKIIPIMYRSCTPPLHLMFYHKLYYSGEGRAMYNFWEKLRQSLVHNPRQIRAAPGLNGVSSSHSALNIEELSNSNGVSNGAAGDGRFFLPPTTTEDTNGHLDSLPSTSTGQDTQSLNIYNNLGDNNNTEKKKKKMSPLKWMLSRGKNRKAKKESQLAQFAHN
ncbi:hypothetical protein O3G_MSEX013092 [Manduca sexta]|uniref:Myeloid differentiation primary response protein MyD88 n=1 Tax=Manduca sexta TaxID=7130 RepID=A0A922CWJ0_MANSE|nr:hypothetical protein O3G_MSEX013092 [Manduca sexta]KAG6462171.1 hypothetical protein O3G_MSEX013092 [Manduca sexta]KAG6462172.1 hypothetical protein O3G_MSEX013092 [Manduca sexta]